MAIARLATGPGQNIELGCGFGAFREAASGTIHSDVAPTPWADVVIDAEDLPVEDGSVRNLVMFDVLHHLPHPLRFFAEAERVLAPGGRIVAVEPYCSLISRAAYRHLHREGADMGVDPFAGDAQSSEDPLDANNALPTLFFWRYLEKFASSFPHLSVGERSRFAFFAYPLSGGLEGYRLAPDGVVGGLARFEPRVQPLASCFAFRCLVAVERAA